LLHQALEVFTRVFGQEHHEIAIALDTLAAIARRRGGLEEAEQLYRRALAIKERVLGCDHPELAATLNNLALVRRVRGDLEEARVLWRRVLAVLDGAAMPAHPLRGLCHANGAALSGEMVSSP
jgi:Flp pilus assembly protein TadD